MTTSPIQDRTPEFRSILQQIQRRQAQQSKIGPQRQSLLNPQQQKANTNNERRQRSEFARKAAEIAKGVTGTMGKLERLAQLAKRKSLFDDRPVEISELTYVIKQDLSALTAQLQQVQALSKSQHGGGSKVDQEGEHNKNVVVLLQRKLADVSGSFKEVLEVRTKNIQASRSRQDNFISSVRQHSNPTSLDPSRTDSPLYSTPQRGRSPKPGYQNQSNGQDVLSLEPSSSSSALTRHSGGGATDQQLLLMEEAAGPSNTYIQERGQAIEAIERTISELGGIFGQLAQMVSEQSEMIQRIDTNTEDVVDNVEGAQRELLKYWGRVSGNRWLVAKMFGVLMICKSLTSGFRKVCCADADTVFLLWVLVAG